MNKKIIATGGAGFIGSNKKTESLEDAVMDYIMVITHQENSDV